MAVEESERLLNRKRTHQATKFGTYRRHTPVLSLLWGNVSEPVEHVDDVLPRVHPLGTDQHVGVVATFAVVVVAAAAHAVGGHGRGNLAVAAILCKPPAGC